MKKILLLLFISFSICAEESSSGIGELNCEGKTGAEKEKCEECQRIVQEQGFSIDSVETQSTADDSTSQR